MTCSICEEIEKKENIIYEDKLCLAMLHPVPSVKGHIIVVPRKHFTIMEDTPMKELQHLFLVANKASSLVFEALGVQGTNITVNNGVPAGQDIPHFSINILPRNQDDGVDFNFKRSQAKDDELEQVQGKLKDCALLIGHEKPDLPLPIEDIEQIAEVEGKENYLLKQLERIP